MHSIGLSLRQKKFFFAPSRSHSFRSARRFFGVIHLNLLHRLKAKYIDVDNNGKEQWGNMLYKQHTHSQRPDKTDRKRMAKGMNTSSVSIFFFLFLCTLASKYSIHRTHSGSAEFIMWKLDGTRADLCRMSERDVNEKGFVECDAHSDGCCSVVGPFLH